MLDANAIEHVVRQLATVRSRGGRVFFLGVGGSAANASHAVNDFRKLTGIECYAPTDNVSELTARTNDEGWPTVFAAWLDLATDPADMDLQGLVGVGVSEAPDLVEQFPAGHTLPALRISALSSSNSL